MQPSHFTTDRPVAVLMVFTAAVVFGYFSFHRLPVTLMPELNYPTLTVRTEYSGAAPEEVENDVSRPIEEALGVLSGLNRISSISRADVSDVVLEFMWGTDMSDATQETLEKLDLVFLPQEAERPLILHFDPALDPIMELSFSGQGARFEGESGLRRLRRIADLQVKRALEPIPGVAAVRVRGGLEEEIHVLLDETKLRRTGIPIQTVIDRLRQENINVAGGNIKEGRAEYMVRTLNEYENLNQIADTVIVRADPAEVRVRDLGRVVRAHKEREMITRTDGGDSVQIDIYKEADANMVAVAKAVAEAVGQAAEPADAPTGPAAGRASRNEGLATKLLREEGARLQVVADRSTFIRNSIDEVRNTAIVGGLLAIAILFLFLNHAKTTAIIAVSIPMSLLITFAPLNLLGVSLNIMSLGGLALGVGMLVDSSIVVLESIHRCREEGDDVKPAAVRGTAEVRGAVIASTLTSIAVFFPMVFVEGIAGQAFGDLGIAVVISLLASLFVAIGFIPMLASRRPPELREVQSARTAWTRFHAWEALQQTWQHTVSWKRWILAPYLLVRFVVGTLLEFTGKLLLLIFTALAGLVVRILGPGISSAGRSILRWPMRVVGGFLAALNTAYPRVIHRALDHPVPVISLVVLCGWATWEAGQRLDSELLPEVHQGEFTFEVGLPVGTPIERTEAILGKVEETLLDNREDIRSILVTFGYDVTNMRRSDEGEHSARFKILLEPDRNLARTEARVIRRLREHFTGIPDLDVRVVRPVLFSSKPPVVVEIQGDDLAVLKQFATQARDLLATLPELADVETTLQSGAPEIQVSYHRDKLILYDLNIGQVARQVRDMVKGFEATRFNLKDRRIPILVQLDQPDREHVADIGRMVLNPSEPEPIALNSIADLTLGEGPSEIRRVDGQRVALVQANLGDGSLGSAVGAVESALDQQLRWPPGLSYVVTGQNEEWERSQITLYLAIGLSMFLVYVIMAAQFESLVQPLIIMLTIPLAFVGSVLGLKLLNVSLSVVVFLGMIMLVGIVVNNAIVLVDYFNLLRRRGLTPREAIATAGSVRLRPILMTTATTVLGLLPMALGLGDGAEIRTPMALTVILGLITSTLLTLIVIPVVCYLVELMKLSLVRQSGEPATAGIADPSPPAS